MQEIKFVIAPDGSVRTEVKGVKGASCKDLTRQIEQALGSVKSSKPTAENFEKPGKAQVKLGNK
jgi:hypothetical protein